MARICCKTKGNASPRGKRRVFFVCHPEDFDKYFEKVCADIFRSHDCAIYYTENMSAEIAEADKVTDLESNSLFVVPVTFKLLTTPNRAMDADIPYAMTKNIPVLPFMMEPGIDAIYARPDKFGERQYLNPYSTDPTEISYGEKLKKYLEAVLISDEMVKKVQAAFDAYIFLSYRKKDRRYANELMRLIHSYPQCRDIAIWYDEFLTPTESFRENIDRVLKDSKLFALLVTPNLLEEPNGQPNFVMGTEYPAAFDSGIGILPAQMEQTDQAALQAKFKGIPPCVDPHTEAFREQLLETVERYATRENDTDSMHNFLIGLAYLDGIDVEVNRGRGLELITFAAEQGLPEAMEKLYHMYSGGDSVKPDYKEAARWAKYLTDYCEVHYGPTDRNTMHWINNTQYIFARLGLYKDALELAKEKHNYYCVTLGPEHPETMLLLSRMANYYGLSREYEKETQLFEKAYRLYRKVKGEDHKTTLDMLLHLSIAYNHLGENERSLELGEIACQQLREQLGDEHPQVLKAQQHLATVHRERGDFPKALELLEKNYELQCKVLGEDHPDILGSMSSLASLYTVVGQRQKGLALLEKAYALYCGLLGEEHPETLTTLYNLIATYRIRGEYKKVLELNDAAYYLFRKHLGTDHPCTVNSLACSGIACSCLGMYAKAVPLLEKAYDRQIAVFGVDDTNTILTLANLAAAYYKLGEDLKAAPLLKKAHGLYCKIYGPEDHRTVYLMELFLPLRRKYGLCRDCGGQFKGLFRKKCSLCGKPKDH